MSIIDLIVGASLIWALFSGWRQGLILQLCSLAGIVLAVWLGIRLGPEAGKLLHLEEEFAPAGGFLAVFVAVLIAVGIAGRLLRRVLRFAGFGILDRLSGAAVSALKTVVILSLTASAFDDLNRDGAFVSEETLERSVCYRPLVGLTDTLFPFLERAKERIISADETRELWNGLSQE